MVYDELKSLKCLPKNDRHKNSNHPEGWNILSSRFINTVITTNAPGIAIITYLKNVIINCKIIHMRNNRK